MSKYCSIMNRKVVYLDCLECKNKKCEEDAIKPIPVRISGWNNANEVLYCCPDCKADFRILSNQENFCHNCGTKIDWGVIVRCNQSVSEMYHTAESIDKENEILRCIQELNNRIPFGNPPQEMLKDYKLSYSTF